MMADLITHRPAIRSIFDDLTALGFADVAKRTGEVLELMARLNELQLELYSVWAALDAVGLDKAEQLELAVEQWRKAQRPPTIPSAGAVCSCGGGRECPACVGEKGTEPHGRYSNSEGS